MRGTVVRSRKLSMRRFRSPTPVCTPQKTDDPGRTPCTSKNGRISPNPVTRGARIWMSFDMRRLPVTSSTLHQGREPCICAAAELDPSVEGVPHPVRNSGGLFDGGDSGVGAAGRHRELAGHRRCGICCRHTSRSLPRNHRSARQAARSVRERGQGPVLRRVGGVSWGHPNVLGPTAHPVDGRPEQGHLLHLFKVAEITVSPRKGRYQEMKREKIVIYRMPSHISTEGI